MAVIALLTDFGYTGPFVGMVKGAIKKIAPDSDLIDLTHSIDSFDIRSAAFILQKSVRHFPKGTIFLTVVDPGVGSSREILAARADDFLFVAPDNGVLSYALAEYRNRVVHVFQNYALLKEPPSATFHGRDIMAPMAAHLANGIDLTELGPKVDSYSVLKFPNLLRRDQSVIGEIVYVDKFGNMISNIDSDTLPNGVDRSQLRLSIGDTRGIPFVGSYSEGRGLSAIISGFGTVEVFLNQARAAEKFPQTIGTTLAVEVL